MDGRSRLESLTGLRFAAAFVVFGLHLEGLFYFSAPYAGMTRFFAQGGTGVSFFFVLSGFVLTWSHRYRDTARAFYRRRIARIGPLHVLTWFAAGLILMFLGQLPSAGPAGASLLALGPWVPSSAYDNAMNVPSWSLGCEAFFYALFPLLLAKAESLTPRQRRQVLAVGVGFIALLAAIAYPARYATLSYWAIYFFPPTRLVEFAIGIVLALEVKEGRLPKIALAPATFVAVGAYAAAGWAPTSFALVAVTLVPFCALIVAAAQRDESGRRSVWSSRPMVLLGSWSFALYLVHFPILVVMAHAESRHMGAWGGVANGVSALVICVAVSGIAFRFVEKPLERRIRPPARPRLPEPAAIAEAI
jgi:peptidoglycan/LPS O-acetylase OafA/YrhL